MILTSDEIRKAAEFAAEQMWPESGYVGWTEDDAEFFRKFIEACRTFYTTPPQPAAQEPTSAVPVVEQLVGALSCNRIMAADSDGNYTKEVTPRIITAAIAAGQQYLKENGK